MKHMLVLGVALLAACSGEPGPAPRLSAADQPTIEAATRKDAATAVVVRRVWSGPEVDFRGSPSPDGRHFSLVDWQTSNGELALRDLTTGQIRRVTNQTAKESGGFALSSVISRDGRSIAYGWLANGVYELRVIATDGTGMRTLISRPYLQPHAWSPDGKQVLAMLWSDDRSASIALVDAQTGSPRLLRSLGWNAPLRLDFSPDGRFIAYDVPSHAGTSERDLHLLAFDGKKHRQLTDDPADERLLGWSPDGASLLFASTRGGSEGIWQLPLAHGKPAGNPVLLRPDSWRILGLGCARTSCFYGVTISQSRIHTAAFDAQNHRVLGTPQPITEASRGDASAAAWSPDGLHLAYVTRVGDLRSPWSLVIHSMRTGEQRELRPRLAQVFRLTWTPDGKSLVVTGSGKGRTGAFRVELETGEAHGIVAMPGPFVPVGPVLSPDGNTLFYYRYRPEDRTLDIVARDLVTGDERVLGPQVQITQNLAISPDGRLLAFTTADPKTLRDRLTVVPAVGGAARVVHELPPQETFSSAGLAWTSDGKTLLFVASVGAERKLFKVPLAGGEPTMLLAMRTRGLQMHPDGRTIVFNSGDWKGEVWVLENLPVSQRVANRRGGQP